MAGSTISQAPEQNILQQLWGGVSGLLAPGGGNLNIPSSNLSPAQVNNAMMSNTQPKDFKPSGAPATATGKTVMGAATQAGRTGTVPASGGSYTPAPQPSGGGGGNSGAQQELDEIRSGKRKWDDNRISELNRLISGSGESAEQAAAKAAEARRQAAYRAYEGKKAAAGVAKESAKSEYDWLIDTLGSNKKDLLDEVALNEKSGVQEYERQEAKTQQNYDKSRKEILTTYRDLNREQEKIMRGAGVATSSRSMEAQLKLNNLLGKDMSELSTNEADSLAMIGTALSTFKERVSLTRNSIETEAKSKADKATLDYNNQVKAIDLNLQLSADAREDAIAAADAQLAADTAAASKWATGLKLQVEMTLAQQKGTLDDFIVDMTDTTKSLNTDLATKQAATQAQIDGITTATTLDKEGNLTMPTGGSTKTQKAKSLASLYDPSKVGLTSGAGATQQGSVQNLSRDPLLSAVLA